MFTSILHPEVYFRIRFRNSEGTNFGNEIASLSLSCTGDSRALETPVFIARQADSPESVGFPIRPNVGSPKKVLLKRVLSKNCQKLDL